MIDDGLVVGGKIKSLLFLNMCISGFCFFPLNFSNVVNKEGTGAWAVLWFFYRYYEFGMSMRVVLRIEVICSRRGIQAFVSHS